MRRGTPTVRPGLFDAAAGATELRYGAAGADTEFYESWTDAPPEFQGPSPMKQVVQALCNPQTPLNILGNFVFNEPTGSGDAKIVP